MRWEAEIKLLAEELKNNDHSLSIECFINKQDVYPENNNFLLQNTVVKFRHLGKVRYACAFCCIQRKEFKLISKQSQHRHTLKCTKCSELFDFNTTKRTLSSDRRRICFSHNSRCKTEKEPIRESLVQHTYVKITKKRHLPNLPQSRSRGSTRSNRLVQAGRKQIQSHKRLKHQKAGIIWRRWDIVGDIHWKWHGGFCTVGYTQIRMNSYSFSQSLGEVNAVIKKAKTPNDEAMMKKELCLFTKLRENFSRIWNNRIVELYGLVDSNCLQRMKLASDSSILLLMEKGHGTLADISKSTHHYYINPASNSHIDAQNRQYIFNELVCII